MIREILKKNYFVPAEESAEWELKNNWEQKQKDWRAELLEEETQEEKEEREELERLDIWTANYDNTQIKEFTKLSFFEKKEMLAYTFYHHDSLPELYSKEFLEKISPILFDKIYQNYLSWNFEKVNENLQKRQLKSLYKTWQDKCNKGEQFLFIKYCHESYKPTKTEK